MRIKDCKVSVVTFNLNQKRVIELKLFNQSQKETRHSKFFRKQIFKNSLIYFKIKRFDVAHFLYRCFATRIFVSLYFKRLQ